MARFIFGIGLDEKERLHEVESWVKPMTEILIGDLVLIVIFTIICVIGIISKKET